MIRSYRELSRLDSFLERFEYLKLTGSVGQETFGFDRYLNQAFYKSQQWINARRFAIARDLGNDLGVHGFAIHDRVLVHHMNPITPDDIAEGNEAILDPEYLICTSLDTHNAIHYGDASRLRSGPNERLPGDTKLW